jgi:hypothetical protein
MDYFLFIDLSKRSIKFTPNGDGIGTYDIFQYQIINSTDTLDYFTIGEFIDSDQSHERLDRYLIKRKFLSIILIPSKNEYQK